MTAFEKSKKLLIIGIIGCLLYVTGDFLFAATGSGRHRKQGLLCECGPDADLVCALRYRTDRDHDRSGMEESDPAKEYMGENCCHVLQSDGLTGCSRKSAGIASMAR